MNDLSDLIAPDAIVARLLATSRRQAIQVLSETLAKAGGIDARTVFDAVLIRERSKGTGIGEGVAVPHAQVAGIKRPLCAFARLEPAQDFEALDGRPADLVFLLISPPDRSGDHLKAFARLSRFMRHADVRERIRAARGADELVALFAGIARAA